MRDKYLKKKHSKNTWNKEKSDKKKRPQGSMVVTLTHTSHQIIQTEIYLKISKLF